MRSDPSLLPRIVRGRGEVPEGWISRSVPFPPHGTLKIALPRGAWEEVSPSLLPHLAYLAELWREVGSPEWSFPERLGEAVPDALWQRQEGVWAVEVDLGYPEEKVRRKVAAYKEGYAGQLWGVVTRSRARLVRALCWPAPCEVRILRRK